MTRRMIRIIAACTLMTAAAGIPAFSTDITNTVPRDTTWGYTATDNTTPPPTEEEGGDSGTPGGEDGTDDTTWG